MHTFCIISVFTITARMLSTSFQIYIYKSLFLTTQYFSGSANFGKSVYYIMVELKSDCQVKILYNASGIYAIIVPVIKIVFIIEQIGE